MELGSFFPSCVYFQCLTVGLNFLESSRRLLSCSQVFFGSVVGCVRFRNITFSLLWVGWVHVFSQTNGHFVLRGLFLHPGRVIGHESKQMLPMKTAELTLTGCGLDMTAAPCDLTRPQFEFCIHSLIFPVFVKTPVLPAPHAAAVTLHLRGLVDALHRQSSGF